MEIWEKLLNLASACSPLSVTCEQPFRFTDVSCLERSHSEDSKNSISPPLELEVVCLTCSCLPAATAPCRPWRACAASRSPRTSILLNMISFDKYLHPVHFAQQKNSKKEQKRKITLRFLAPLAIANSALYVTFVPEIFRVRRRPPPAPTEKILF